MVVACLMSESRSLAYLIEAEGLFKRSDRRIEAIKSPASSCNQRKTPSPTVALRWLLRCKPGSSGTTVGRGSIMTRMDFSVM